MAKTIEHDHLALSMAADALHFLDAADKVLSGEDRYEPPRDSAAIRPSSFLIAHAAELLLKAAAQIGDAPEQPGNHDLAGWLKAAKGTGLSFTSDFEMYVERTTDAHLGHYFRYASSTGSYSALLPGWTYAVVLAAAGLVFEHTREEFERRWGPSGYR